MTEPPASGFALRASRSRLRAARRRLGLLAIAAVALSAARAAPAAAQVDELEWSLRLGAGAAGIDEHSMPAVLIQTSITWPAGERMRVGPVLELIGIADLDDCPLVPGADCGSPPSPLGAASLRLQGARTGPYVYAQPSLFFWDQGERNRIAAGGGLGIGYRGEGMSGFSAELGLSSPLTDSPAPIVSLTVGFAMEVRPPGPPTPPVPALPPASGRGDR